jgi:hypothetical protein
MKRSKVKGKGYPTTGRGGSRGSGYVKAPDFLDVRHYKSGRSSVICTGRLYPFTHFQSLSRPQVTWFRRRELRKKSPVTPPGINPGTVRLVAQCLNHYATLGPSEEKCLYKGQRQFLRLCSVEGRRMNCEYEVKEDC